MRIYFQMHDKYIAIPYTGVIMRVEGLPQWIYMEERVARIILDRTSRIKQATRP